MDLTEYINKKGQTDIKGQPLAEIVVVNGIPSISFRQYSSDTGVEIEPRQQMISVDSFNEFLTQSQSTIKDLQSFQTDIQTATNTPPPPKGK